MDIQKKFSEWFDNCKMEMSIERNMKMAFQAGATLMSDRVKDAEDSRDMATHLAGNRIGNLRSDLDTANDRVKELEAVVSSQAKEIKELKRNNGILEVANRCGLLNQDTAMKRIETLRAENEKLKERCERQIWNLGGISTLLLGVSIDEFNKDYALPALTDTNEFVKKHNDLQQRLDKAVEIIKRVSKNANYYEQVDLENECEKFLEANPLDTSQVVDTTSANSECKHEWGDYYLLSNPPQRQCKKCGFIEFIEPKVESNVSTQDLEIQARNCDNCGEKNNLHYNYDYENKCSISVLCNECGHITPIDSKEVEKRITKEAL